MLWWLWLQSNRRVSVVQVRDVLNPSSSHVGDFKFSISAGVWSQVPERMSVAVQVQIPLPPPPPSPKPVVQQVTELPCPALPCPVLPCPAVRCSALLCPVLQPCPVLPLGASVLSVPPARLSVKYKPLELGSSGERCERYRTGLRAFRLGSDHIPSRVLRVKLFES